MFTQKLVVCLLAILLVGALWRGDLRAAPEISLPPSPGACSWQGRHLAHGNLRYSPVRFQGNVIRFDIYRCQNAAWIYAGSSADVMP